MRSGPTRVRPLGLVASGPGEPPLNVANWALPPAPRPEAGPIPVIAALGTSMDSGKTTSAADLARGASLAGLRVGYGKVTGTGAMGDPMLLRDAGADAVLDFTDVGHVSTYRLSPREIESIFLQLLGHLQQSGVDLILVEVADGLLQEETAQLVASEGFRRHVHASLFAAPDAMSALAAAGWLREHRLPLLGLCGTIEASPLQVREATGATGLAHYGRADLSDPATATKLISLATAQVH
jgi:molybdopterin-guanine dinucleotide biosynthesis protein